MKYFIANWKANKDINQAKTWVNDFINLINNDSVTLQKFTNEEIKVIICPSFPLIYPIKEMLNDFKNIELGSQDVSVFKNGIYTGEVTASNLSTLVNYAIIGHSERKKNNHETLETDIIKINNAKKNNIEPIYCIADIAVSVPSNVKFVCLEPPVAISTGDGRGNFISPDKIVEELNRMNSSLSIKFIYGGSVNKDNIKLYLRYNEIDGFLIGGASLDPKHFYDIISQA